MTITEIANQGEIICGELQVSPEALPGISLSFAREQFKRALNDPLLAETDDAFLESAASYIDSAVSFFFSTDEVRYGRTVKDPVGTLRVEMALISANNLPDHNTVKQLYQNGIDEARTLDSGTAFKDLVAGAFSSSLLTLIGKYRG